MEKADLVLHEGRILGYPGDSIAVTGGRIAAHGSYTELKALVGSRTHLIRLAGRTVAPGFIDSHLHFLEGAAAASGVPLWRCRTAPELLTGLRVAAAKTPPGNWLRAFGADEALMRERRGPSRQELDQAVPRNPLRLRHQTLHASWLNSRAIAALKLESPKFDWPESAYAGRDEAGRLTGFTAGMEEWITRSMPLVTSAEIEARARIFSRELAAAGVTAFTDATVRNGIDEVALFAKLIRNETICQRVGMMIGAQHLDNAVTITHSAEEAGIRIAGIKIMPGVPHGSGPLARRIADALLAGLDAAFHVTEIEELENALQAIEAARALVDAEVGAVCRIEHGGLIPPDYVGRIAAAGAWVVVNPGFIHYRGAKYAGEPGLIPFLHRTRSLREAGVRLAGGTDAPVTPARPLVAIAAAMTRSSLEGYELAPGEKLDAGESFALFTSAAASLAGLEAGRLAPGCLADMIVMAKDPFALSPAELMNLAVDITLIGGKVVYERGRPAVASSASAELHST
ncbi:MAG: amidohydrolase [Candidatus Binataceae bacterium]